MQIRLANAADIPALCQLLAQLFAQEHEFIVDPQKQARGLAAIIEQPACGQILLAEQDGRVLGMVSLLYSQSTALGAPVAWLEDMVVDAGCRTGGIGSALLTAARELAISQGCRRITLLTDADNQAAQRFYARQGFSASSMLPMRLLLD